MPMIWTEPEVACEHNGVVVYHTYKDQDISQSRQYWYTLDQTEDEENEFDIRDLDAWMNVAGEDHIEILKAAIESGELKMVED